MSESEHDSGSPAARQGMPPKKRQARRGGGGGSQLDPDAWMVTFSDLLTLLMTFFVLIFASQDPVPAEKLHEAFGQTTGVFGMFRTGFLERITALNRTDLNEDLVQVFLTEIGAPEISVEQQGRGLVVTLPSDTFFAPGRAEINAKALTRLDQLAEFLAASRHRIRVEGHTDNQERPRPPYPDIWELSLGRAHGVLTRLISKGVPENRLSLMGHGAGRPKAANRTRLGRALNRRVEIVIINETRSKS